MTDPISQRYGGFFGAITMRSNYKGVSHNTIYPLNATDSNGIIPKLRWAWWDSSKGNQPEEIRVTDQPINKKQGATEDTESQLYFTSEPLPPNSGQDSPVMLTEYGKHLGNSYRNYLAMQGDDKTYLTDNNHYVSPISNTWIPYSNLIKGENDFNLRFQGGIYDGGPCRGDDCTGNMQPYDNILCNKGDTSLYFDSATDPTSYSSSACKWRTDQEAFACCTADPKSYQGNQPFEPGKTFLESYCADAFMPDNLGSQCSNFMLNICEKNWDSEACTKYLQSFANNSNVKQVAQTTIINYINNMSNKTSCGTNQYTTPNSPNRCKPPGSSEYRDDSKDDFLVNTLPFLCNAGNDGATVGTGICDGILNQYCAQFTREDLLNLDNNGTLQMLCGCHLSSSSSGTVNNVGLNLGNPVVQPNQYPYPGITSACDPICSYSKTIPAAGPSCASTVCILDNISINEINSTVNGGITINQACKNTGGSGRATCYISGLDINSINSQTGGVQIKNGCDACYAFCPDEDWDQNAPASAVKVDCNNISNFNCGSCKSGKCDAPPATGNGGGTGNGSSSTGGGTFINRIQNHPYASMFVGVGVFVLFIIIFTMITMYYQSD